MDQLHPVVTFTRMELRAILAACRYYKMMSPLLRARDKAYALDTVRGGIRWTPVNPSTDYGYAILYRVVHCKSGLAGWAMFDICEDGTLVAARSNPVDVVF